ncbi:uncharacterized protein TrAFT101_012059 [Trichoderma asperellum]|uniref:uncharacterized protein n=1 Tax=Trichoderma asperellum TaxID=101201 RepID=UPI0033271A43|nr:hypothetical protein TrAFT101_012059 [Trichoderma asperellum]
MPDKSESEFSEEHSEEQAFSILLERGVAHSYQQLRNIHLPARFTTHRRCRQADDSSAEDPMEIFNLAWIGRGRGPFACAVFFLLGIQRCAIRLWERKKDKKTPL